MECFRRLSIILVFLMLIALGSSGIIQPSQNTPHQYLEQVSQKKCPAGKYKDKEEPHKNQTKCVPCKPGTYTEKENSLSKCLKCFGPCKGFSVETVACNKTTNRKCECAFQYYCATEDVTKCEHCVKCDSGNGPHKGNEIHYREACQTCSSGTFRNSTHMHKCQPHTNCTALGMILHYKGNSTSDNICEYKRHDVQPTIFKKHTSPVNLYMVLITVVMTILCILVILRSSRCNTSNIQEIGMLVKLRFICICDTEGTHGKCDDNEEEIKLKTVLETGRALDGSLSETKPRTLMAMMCTDETEAPTMEYRSEILDIETMSGIGSTEDNIPFPVQENGRNSNTYYPIEEQNQKQYYQPVMMEAKSGIQASSYVHDGKYWLD